MIAMSDVIALLNKLSESDLLNIPISSVRAKVVYKMERALIDCAISSQVGDRQRRSREYF